jgi:hypothetical protein
MLARVLILSPFKYIYKNKQLNCRTGESFYLNLDIPQEKEEINYLLNSEYSELVYIENKPTVVSKLQIDSSPSEKENEETNIDTDTVAKETSFIAEQVKLRTEELMRMHWREIKDVAETFGVKYIQKEETIKKIIELEFSAIDVKSAEQSTLPGELHEDSTTEE